MTETAISEVELPEDVTKFCQDRGLREALQRSIAIARETFQNIRCISVELEIDPETDDEAIVVQVSAAMSVDEAVQAKGEYTRKWVRVAPAEARQDMRLLLDIS